MKKFWDNKIKVLWYSHPRVAIALTLVLINLVIIAIFTGILSFVSGNSFFDELAYVFTYTMAADGIYDFVESNEDLTCFIIKLVLGIIQMVIFSGALIGFTTDVLQTTIDARLRNVGKISLHDHYVFLNWSSISPRVIYDLSFLGGKKNVIILTDRDREDVLNSIESVFTDNKCEMKNLRIFIKEGDPMSSKDLDDISLSRAKYIGIFLSDIEGEGDEEVSARDLNSIKILLTMMNINTSANIVVEVEDSRTQDKIEGLLGLSDSALGRNIIAFSHNAVVGHIIGRSLVNTAYDTVYNELLSYEGVEFYGIEAFDIEEALYKYNDCIPVVNYDDDDRLDENGEKAADHLYILSDNRESLGVRAEPKSYVRPLVYSEKKARESFTVFIASRDNNHGFIISELDLYAKMSNISVVYKSYTYDRITDMMEDIAGTKGQKKVLLLSSSAGDANQDADVFLGALELKLRGNLGPDTSVYAEIINPINTNALQNLGVVSVIVSNRIVSLFMLQLLTHSNSKKFYRDLISVNDGDGNDAIDIDIITACELLVFEGEYISFSCQAELVQSFYVASGKTKMCLGIKHGDSIRFLCDGMDKEEDLRIYPNDDLILAVY